VLLALAIGLWISINWYIQQIGLVDAAKQQEALFGPQAAAEGQTGGDSSDDKAAAGSEAKPADKKQQ